MQKLSVLQRWFRHRLGGCSATHTDDPGQGGRADRPVGLFRLVYLLGAGDDCPLHLSAAKALGVEPPTGKELIDREPLGGLVPATVMGNGNASDLKQAEALGLELAPVSLQQLIVHLTSEPSQRKAERDMSRLPC